MNVDLRQSLFMLVFSVGLLITIASHIPAQFQPRMQTDELFLMAPRTMQRLLTEGRAAIEQGRYADGIAALGAILHGEGQDVADDLAGRDFFVDRPVRNLYSKSLKSEAIEALNRLPAEGRKILELQFGVKARQLLDAAIAQRNTLAIAEVARQYVHTQAGYDAMVLVAQLKLTDGYPLAAASVLQSLLDYPAARERYGAQLAFLATTAWLHAGMDSRAAKTLELASRDFGGQSITVAGQQIPIEDVQGILKNIRLGSGSIAADNTASQWLTSGGSAARNATSQLGLPLPNERWEWFIHSSRPEGQALRTAEEMLRKSGALLLPRMELRMLDNTVVCRSNDSTVVGIDFRSGMLQWRRPTVAGVAPLKRGAWEGGDQLLSRDLLNRIWGSTAFGRITCDAQRCYHVVQIQDEVESMRGALPMTTTRLEGVSLARQGAILWSIGGSDSDEPQLSGAYFMGPPLPYAGQLYSIVEINGEVELVVLDPESGKLQWRQQLASAVPIPIGLDLARQSIAMTPSIADGVVVCPTGVGGVVAIDLLTRSLRWGAVYPARGVAAGFNSPLLPQEYEPLQSRWLDEGLIIDSGVVVVSPPESDLLLCFDLLSGERLLESRRGAACYVAGIDGENLITVGQDQVLIENFRSKEKNSVRYPNGFALVGKGVWQAGQIMLPLTNQRIIQVDLRTHQIVGEATVAQPLGNLFAYQGQLLSVGSSSITAYYTRSQLESEVQQRLAKNPQDTWGLNHKSQLLLSDGKTLEALQQLLVAFQANPEDDDTRFFLSDVMLTGLRENFSEFVTYADQLDTVIQALPQRLEYLQLMAQGLIQRQDYLGAFGKLWEVMKQQQTALVTGAQSRSNRLQISENHWADVESWFSAALGRCYRNCSDDQRAEMDRLIGQEVHRISQTVLPVRRQLMRFLAQVPAADSANLELAQQLVGRHEQIQAEQIWQWITVSENSNSRIDATAGLRQLTGLDQRIRLAEGAAAVDSQWPQGVVTGGLDQTVSAIYSNGRPIEVTGQRFGRPDFSVNAMQGGLSLADVNGRPLYNLLYRSATSDLTGGYMSAQVRGGLILLETMSELVAFDLYRGMDRQVGQSILWRHSLDATAPQEPFQPAQMHVTEEPLGIQSQRRRSDNRRYAEVGPLLANVKVLQSGNSIIGLDPYTGRQLWSRDGYNDQVRLAGSGSNDHLFIVNPSRGVTERIDARDGQMISESTYLVQEMQQRTQANGQSKWNPWFSSGAWLVDYRGEDTSSKIILRVWSPEHEKVIAELPLPKSARVVQTDRQLVVVLDPMGQMVVVDLINGQTHRYQVPLDKDLGGVNALRFADHLVVVSSRNTVQSRLPIGSSEVAANGYVYSIDLSSHQLAWSQPGRLINMTIPLSQPRSSPFMMAYRQASNQEAPLSTNLILLDLRSGQLASVVEGILVAANRPTVNMQVRPQEHQIAIAVGDKNYRFQVTGQHGPPEPIMHYGGVYEKPLTIKRDEKTLFK
jgi:hypothetical protein